MGLTGVIYVAGRWQNRLAGAQIIFLSSVSNHQQKKKMKLVLPTSVAWEVPETSKPSGFSKSWQPAVGTSHMSKTLSVRLLGKARHRHKPKAIEINRNIEAQQCIDWSNELPTSRCASCCREASRRRCCRAATRVVAREREARTFVRVAHRCDARLPSRGSLARVGRTIVQVNYILIWRYFYINGCSRGTCARGNAKSRSCATKLALVCHDSHSCASHRVASTITREVAHRTVAALQQRTLQWLAFACLELIVALSKRQWSLLSWSFWTQRGKRPQNHCVVSTTHHCETWRSRNSLANRVPPCEAKYWPGHWGIYFSILWSWYHLHEIWNLFVNNEVLLQEVLQCNPNTGLQKDSIVDHMFTDKECEHCSGPSWLTYDIMSRKQQNLKYAWCLCTQEVDKQECKPSCRLNFPLTKHASAGVTLFLSSIAVMSFGSDLLWVKHSQDMFIWKTNCF